MPSTENLQSLIEQTRNDPAFIKNQYWPASFVVNMLHEAMKEALATDGQDETGLYTVADQLTTELVEHLSSDDLYVLFNRNDQMDLIFPSIENVLVDEYENPVIQPAICLFFDRDKAQRYVMNTLMRNGEDVVSPYTTVSMGQDFLAENRYFFFESLPSYGGLFVAIDPIFDPDTKSVRPKLTIPVGQIVKAGDMDLLLKDYRNEINLGYHISICSQLRYMQSLTTTMKIKEELMEEVMKNILDGLDSVTLYALENDNFYETDVKSKKTMFFLFKKDLEVYMSYTKLTGTITEVKGSYIKDMMKFRPVIIKSGTRIPLALAMGRNCPAIN